MIPVIIIRPQPGCDASVGAARAAGLDARGFSLFTVRPVPWSPPDPAGIDALLAGSANAFRHGGEGLSAFRGKPVHAVGRVTAQAAREAGFAVATVGEGSLQAVLGRIDPAHRRLLRLAGRERIALDPPPGATIVERVLYASDAGPMPPELVGLLRMPALILLHSGMAARHFAAECARVGIDRAMLRLAAIGPRVAQVAGGGWDAVVSAPRPDDAALLALAGEMCQTRGETGSVQRK